MSEAQQQVPPSPLPSEAGPWVGAFIALHLGALVQRGVLETQTGSGSVVLTQDKPSHFPAVALRDSIVL